MTSSKAGALVRHSSDWRRGLLANWSAVQNFATDSSPCTSPALSGQASEYLLLSEFPLDIRR
jgi:hypothetical protein